MPLVSVVVATCSRDELLALALKSCQRSDYPNLEIIVSDDAGSESTRRLVNSFNDGRIRYRSNKQRVGMAANHLFAFREMRGQLFTVLNDDDEWAEGYPDQLIPIMIENPDIVLAFSDHFVIDQSGHVDLTATEANTKRWHREILAPGRHQPFRSIALVDNSVPMAQASLVRKDLIDWVDFPITVGTHYDLWLTYLAARGGGAAYYLPERLTRYRVHPGSDTATFSIDKGMAGVFVWSRFISDSRLCDCRDALLAKYAQFNESVGIDLIRVGRSREARALLLKSLQIRSSVRAFAALALSFSPDRPARAIISMARSRY
jgi:glycosyltransferase involved in cell wall biosynthesis